MSQYISIHSLRKRLFSRFKNTFLQAPWLWNLVINPESFATQHSTRLNRLFLKLAWFWPRLADAEQWRDATSDNHRDPGLFVKIDTVGKLFVDEVCAVTPDTTSPVVDICCNCGRFLNQLRERGYTNLHGVDISRAAYEHMGTVFPELAAMVRFDVGTLQEYLEKQPDYAFSTTMSHGATLEIIHPSFPLIRHICRVTRDNVVLILHEAGHSYPRFWEWEFNKYGFYLSKVQRPAAPDTPNSLLVFKRQ